MICSLRQCWSNGINSFSKMDTYKSFKSRFLIESYFNAITNRAHIVSYTKMRISNHKLAIETGRYKNIRVMKDIANFVELVSYFKLKRKYMLA